MPRSDYLEILDEAEAAEPRGDVWDLDAEADRLSVKLDDLPMDEKGWDRAVNVAYRRCALRAHPDKHPPEQRNAAEANFKRLNESHKILLRVGKAVRFEAESGDAAAHIEASRRAELDAEKEEKAALSRRLASVMSLNGVAAGFNSFTNRGNQEGFVPQPERVGRRASDLQKQMASLLARCGDEFQKLARRRRRRRALRRALAFGLGVAFLWFVRKNAPQEDDLEDARNELRQIAEGLRAAIRFMGAELATAVGRPQDADEMADDLEAAFLEGRMSVNEEGGLEVLIPDDEAPGMYYKLNMSSKEDGSMSVWTEGVDGQRVEVELGDADGWDDEPAPGVFGLPAERAGGGRGTVRFETETDDCEKNERRRKKESKGDKKETKKRLFGGWGKGNP